MPPLLFRSVLFSTIFWFLSRINQYFCTRLDFQGMQYSGDQDR